MADKPAWLTDEAIERTQALGHEVAKFLVRRREQKLIDSDAEVDLGPRLQQMLADLEVRNDVRK